MRQRLWLLACCLVSAVAAADHNQTQDKDVTDQDQADDQFLRRLFDKYGDGNRSMTFEGFEHLLESLGLESKIRDHGLADHIKGNRFVGSMHKDHTSHSIDTAKNDTDEEEEHHHKHQHHHHHREEGTSQETSTPGSSTTPKQDRVPVVVVNKCLSAAQILAQFNSDHHSSISEAGFRNLCPAIVYELDQKRCRITDHQHDSEHEVHVLNRESPMLIWLLAAAAVVAISLVGLMAILFIPIIQNDHHGHLLQLLVGLAIGTLTGDALLHLLPHAFSAQIKWHDVQESGHDEHNHDSVWFGLMALVGIITFLTFERVVTIVSDLCNKSKNQTKVSTYKRAPDNDQSVTSPTELESLKSPNGDHVKDEMSTTTCFQGQAHEIQVNPANHQHNHHQHNHHHGKSSALSTQPLSKEQCHRETIVYPHPDPDRGYVVQLTDHHHHHQHQPGQSSAKSVIYMVVTGDGLHNFCDGIAIGVAFAGGGFGGGLSTTIAVMCHELPHEVGDFAVLIRAGLSVRRAIIYNLMSGVLCFAGMSLGVAVGKINQTWLSAAVAGMFLYIALVDMIPQLDCCPNSSGTARSFKLTVQLVGISLGVGIMCLISVYESSIKSLGADH